MSERKTPLCPKYKQGWYAGAAYEQWMRDAGEQLVTMEQVNAATAMACACDGSRCAWWVQNSHRGTPLWSLDDEGSPETDASLQPIPFGRCSKNLRAAPWPDPATTKENQP
jgi:hypothetical protein